MDRRPTGFGRRFHHTGNVTHDDDLRNSIYIYIICTVILTLLYLGRFVRIVLGLAGVRRFVDNARIETAQGRQSH